MKFSRRTILKAAVGAVAAVQLIRWTIKEDEVFTEYTLTAESLDTELIPGHVTHSWQFNGGYPASIIRAKQGRKIRINFINNLSEPSTIHWHGLRIPIDMDGVPFLSQAPVMPGTTFIYEFTPKDAGTFWYHPHMNSTEQLGKGLVGAFIVEEATSPGFDHDSVFCLKNWHIDDEGQFTPFSIPRYAARMGTPGRYLTVNNKHKPVEKIPAGGWCRLRFLNVDNTVLYRLRVKNHSAWVIAIDGNAIESPVFLEHFDIAPGMRVDIALEAPVETGQLITIQNGKGRFFFDLMTLVTEAVGQVMCKALPKLPMNPVPEPDLDNATVIPFVFEWAGAITPVDRQGKASHDFWVVNKRAWEGMTRDNIPEPLARLKLGETYIFELINVTPMKHPIHLHGHTWTVLSSNKKTITPFHTDTVLLEKNERVKVAFVADNPGRWMYHCHVIEHMKTGLMGYVEVS